MASSSVDTGIGCWDLVSGAEQLRYRSCASPPHGLLSVSRRFLASSQLRENPSSSSAPIFLWSWEKVYKTPNPFLQSPFLLDSLDLSSAFFQPQVQVRSFPAEPIGPLVSDSDGSYIIGGGSSGAIYIWEVIPRVSFFCSLSHSPFSYHSHYNSSCLGNEWQAP